MTRKREKGWRDPRPIVERIVVVGDLVLRTPAHFGGGDPDPFSNVDMTLLRHPSEGKVLLTGASITGALRNYLREVELGYAQQVDLSQERRTKAVALFGGSKGDDKGVQSALIVDDVFADAGELRGAWEIELRDGVRIEAGTRTAADEAKFDTELLPAGTTFRLRFELLVPEGQSDVLRQALATALHGLETNGRDAGEITLGARKRRGFGCCRVDEWTVTRYDLTDPEMLIAWLDGRPGVSRTRASIAEALDVTLTTEDRRHRFEIKVTFALAGSLLVRSGFGDSDSGPDMVHLHALQPDGQKRPVMSGTGLAGAVRHRALCIANTLRPYEGERLVNAMFGSSERGALTASRVEVGEAVIRDAVSLVQSRVAIDRFTGGAYETALFNEQPVFDNGRSRLDVRLSLRNPRDYEVGLLLQVLKDLWAGDLPVGGESSVGRGRLQGVEAQLAFCEGVKVTRCTIRQDGEGVLVDGELDIEKYARALKNDPWEAEDEA